MEKALLWTLRKFFKAARWLHTALSDAGRAVYPSLLAFIPYLLARPVFRLVCLLFAAIYALQERQLQRSQARIDALRQPPA